MTRLKINNIGAISSIDIELKKLNVIIGPQSSGKSTICKLACYCSWVEKKASLSRSFDFFLNDNKFYLELSRFHKLKGYFRHNSSFEYESDVIKFSYIHKDGGGMPSFEWKDRYAYKRGKISYIPSERNLVSSIDNWLEVKFEDNNIRNFMIDWNNARKEFTKDKPLSILKLGINYYYDSQKEKDSVIVNCDGTELELTNTSSGLQSVIPLEVVCDYLTTHIYRNNVNSSVIEDTKNKALRDDIYKEKFNSQEIEFDSSGGEISLTFVEDNNDFRIFRSTQEYNDYKKIINQFLNIYYTRLYIEEPEQNIFPETQQDIVYYLLRTINQNEGHELFLTTHSPYIINAINNCMMGYHIKNAMPIEEQNTLHSKEAWINSNLVGAYELTMEGTLVSIISEKTKTIGSHYFNRIMNKAMDQYYDMLEYFGDKSNED